MSKDDCRLRMQVLTHCSYECPCSPGGSHVALHTGCQGGCGRDEQRLRLMGGVSCHLGSAATSRADAGCL